MTLRTRLALFFAVSIAAALMAQGALGYLTFRQQAYNSLDRDLSVYLAQVQANLERSRDPRGSPRDAQLLNEFFEGYIARARVIYEGEVVSQHEGFPPNVPTELVDAPQTYGVWRVGSIFVSPPGATPAFTIQGAISSVELTRGLERYRRTLFISVLGVSALGALAAFILSRPALQPLQQLLTTAQRVASSGDLSLRVPQEGRGELGELSETFNHMLERLAAFRARESAFTRSASHELRTPLTSMKLHLSSYRQGYGSTEETLATLDQEVERMTRLSEALLILAREGRAQRLSVNLSNLAREAAEEAGATYEGPEALEPPGDPILIRQALGNLLENARKHAPGADVTVTLQTRTDSGQAFAVLGVTDTGPGLSAEVRERASEAFYRAPGTLAPGSGLGLAVASQVAEAHGGRLELRPNIPQGLIAELCLRLELVQ